MKKIILERIFDQEVTLDDIKAMAAQGASCFNIYNVDWQQSMFANDGKKLFCHFEAPDTESLRNAIRQSGSDYDAAWPCSQHDTDLEDFNVVVERTFSDSVNFDEIAAKEEAGSWCLETHNVKFVRTYFSQDCKRMICLYNAPDAESVRIAQTQAEMPFDAVWPCRHLTPALFGA